MDKKQLIDEVMALQQQTDLILRQFEPQPWIELNLTLAQLKSLFFIASKEKTNFKKLAEALGVTPPNVTGIIDRLVEQGLVTRTENPEDRRIMLLQATETGHQLLVNLRERTINQMSQVLSYLNIEELEMQIRILKDLKRAAETHLRKIKASL
ncbi:MAG TPA: MarR family transcriptional regulator [Dehalococcoidales bacterium]|nr:MarR family transcriptional regulator [Dehalococcoidales bacterium]